MLDDFKWKIDPTSHRKKWSTLKTVLVMIAATALLAGAGLWVTADTAMGGKVRDPFTHSNKARFKQPCHAIAHRGFHGVYEGSPVDENTARSAYVSGLKDAQPEADLRLSATHGTLVTVHNDTIKEMTGFNGRPEEMTIEEIQSHPTLRAGDVIPTFRQWLQGARDGGVRWVVVEGKRYPQHQSAWDSWGIEQAVADAEAVGVRVFWTGTNGFQSHVRAADSDAEFLWRVDGDETLTVETARQHHASIVEVPTPAKTNAKLSRQLRDAGVRVASRNSTIAEWPEYFTRGVTWFQTNTVNAANKWCRKQAAR